MFRVLFLLFLLMPQMCSAQKKTVIRLIQLDDKENVPLRAVIGNNGARENIVSLLLHGYEKGQITPEEGTLKKTGFQHISKLQLISIDTTKLLLTDVWIFKDNHLSVVSTALSLVSLDFQSIVKIFKLYGFHFRRLSRHSVDKRFVKVTVLLP
jgi:hypothetical protein